MDSLIKNLPKYYNRSAVIAAILLPQENELKRILAAVEDAEKQMFISEATTALSLYEADLGITPNLSEDYDTRRNRILAKLRGLGTTTLSVLERVVKTYIDGIIHIEEKPSEYTINIKVVTRKGVPDNLSNIEKEISEIIPAHLKYEINLMYMKNAQIYMGSALHGGTNTQMKVGGMDLEKYILLTDEDGNYLTDENGLILFE